MLRSTKVFSRLLFAFLFATALPLVVVAYSAYSYYSNLATDNVGNYVDGLLNQTAQHIEGELSRLESDAVNLIVMPQVQSFVINYPYLSQLERYQGQREVAGLVASRLSLLHHISDVLFITNDCRHIIPVYGGTDRRFDTRMVDLGGLAGQAAALNGKTVYSSVYEYARTKPKYYVTQGEPVYERSGILMTKQFFHNESNIIVGYLVIRVNEPFFSEMFQDLEIGDGSTINLIDSQGVVLSSTDKLSIGRLFEGASDTDHLQHVRKRVMDQETLYSYYPVRTPELTAVAAIPRGFLRSGATEIAAVIAAIAGVCIVFSLVLSLLITHSISRPLGQLTHKMQLVREGRFAPMPDDQHRDELALVQNTFNHMVQTIERLVAEIREGEREKTALQLKALVAQINPHFINNTLGSIKLVAGMQNAVSIESMVTSLSNILSAIMGKEGDCIPIKQELALLDDYINLQQFRTFESIVYHTDIDPQILDSEIPRFTLQPVVENSIVHGFSGLHRTGEILVEGIVRKDKILLSITDNGCGIPEEQIAHILLDKPDGGREDRIGVYNVNRRIQLLYGEQYGLRIKSVKDRYTRVDILLPWEGERL